MEVESFHILEDLLQQLYTLLIELPVVVQSRSLQTLKGVSLILRVIIFIYMYMYYILYTLYTLQSIVIILIIIPSAPGRHRSAFSVFDPLRHK